MRESRGHPREVTRDFGNVLPVPGRPLVEREQEKKSPHSPLRLQRSSPPTLTLYIAIPRRPPPGDPSRRCRHDPIDVELCLKASAPERSKSTQVGRSKANFGRVRSGSPKVGSRATFRCALATVRRCDVSSVSAHGRARCCHRALVWVSAWACVGMCSTRACDVLQTVLSSARSCGGFGQLPTQRHPNRGFAIGVTQVVGGVLVHYSVEDARAQERRSRAIHIGMRSGAVPLPWPSLS